MKQKTITTDKATLLVRELPEGAKDVRVETNQSIIPYGKMVHYEVPATKESYGYEETEGFALPEGNWQLLGRMPDITEEQWKVVVDYFTTDEEFGKEDVFRDYLDKSFFDTATESGVSLLQANGVYFENHLGRYPDSESYLYRDALGITSNYWSDLLEWQEAQSKVWDKECCYLFIKVD